MKYTFWNRIGQATVISSIIIIIIVALVYLIGKIFLYQFLIGTHLGILLAAAVSYFQDVRKGIL